MTKQRVHKLEFATLFDSICSAIHPFEKDIIIEFNDGFWVDGFDHNKKYIDTYRSFESKVRIVEISKVRVLTSNHMNLSWEDLIESVNEGRIRLEFLAELREEKETVLKCDILRNNQENETIFIRFECKRIVKTFKKADYTRVW